MQSERNKKIGLIIMSLGAIGFFGFFIYFNLSGAALDSKNIPLLVKIIFTTAFLPAGLYFGLYFTSGKKLALQIGGGGALFLIIAYILGFLLH
jgi:hypothetical protein